MSPNPPTLEYILAISTPEVLDIILKSAGVFAICTPLLLYLKRCGARVWQKVEHLDRIPEIHRSLMVSGVKLSALLENGSYATFVCDLSGANLEVNGNYCRLVGALTGDLLGFGWRNFISDAELDKYDKRWKPAIEEWQDYNTDLKLRHRDGREVSVELKVSAVFNPQGDAIGFCGMMHEVHDGSQDSASSSSP